MQVVIWWHLTDKCLIVKINSADWIVIQKWLGIFLSLVKKKKTNTQKSSNDLACRNSNKLCLICFCRIHYCFISNICRTKQKTVWISISSPNLIQNRKSCSTAPNDTYTYNYIHICHLSYNHRNTTVCTNWKCRIGGPCVWLTVRAKPSKGNTLNKMMSYYNIWVYNKYIYWTYLLNKANPWMFLASL